MAKLTVDPIEREFLKAIKEGKDTAAPSVYADWLEDQGRTAEAARQRVKCGLSEVFYVLQRDDDSTPVLKRRRYRTLSGVRGKITALAQRAWRWNSAYPFPDREKKIEKERQHWKILVVEYRPQVVGELPPTREG